MAQHPCFPLWTDAYLGDTGHLSTTEHGAYLLLLITMWRNKGSLPNDDKLLARYARLTSTQWRRIKPILMPFFEVDGDELRQARLTDEYAAVRRQSLKQSDKAKARWLKEKKTAMPVHSPGNASPTPTPYIRESDDSLIGKKNGKRLPDDWSLPDEWRQLAIKEGLPTDMVETEATKFANYWQAKSGNGATKRDWKKTWHNWILNAGKHGNGTGKKRSNLQAEYDAFAAVVRRL